LEALKSLTADVRGEVEGENKVLMIRRVRGRFHMRASDPAQVCEIVDCVHKVYAEGCPVYRSLKPAFQITSSAEVVSEQEPTR
jgi:uncharacterized OsmC-like protein